MKNKKIIVVFILIIAYLFIMLAGVKATNPLPLFNNDEPGVNDEQPTTAPTPTPTPSPSQTPTQIPTPTPTPTPSSNGNNTPNDSLPDTGVAGDTALFVFITICIASSIYAFVKIRNYKNV